MKKIYFLLMLLLPAVAWSQTKSIAMSELTVGSGMFFGAQMSTTTITVTVKGPSDRFIAFGFGAGMAIGNDAIIWSTLGTGAAPLTLRDHRMIGQGNEPSVDAQQDWTVTSNTVAAGVRTIIATRALNTGDANDVVFTFASTTQNLFWAKSATASNTLENHGPTNRASGIVRNWVMDDQTAPALAATPFSPADNATGVATNTNLAVTFNENVALGTGLIELVNLTTNTVVESFNVATSALVTVNNATVTINPTNNLADLTGYFVRIANGAIKDLSGNNYAGFNNNTTWNFTSADGTPPLLAATPFSPADNAINVAVGTNLTVTFNENIQVGTGLIELFDASNTLVESFNVATSPLVTVNNATVTINPTNNLSNNIGYYIHIANGAIKDLAGNNYAGFNNNTTWNFTTPDNVAPTLAAIAPFSPADNAINVPVSSNLVVNFNENVALGTGLIELVNLTTNVVVESFNVASSPLVTVTNAAVTINPTNNLTDLTGYFVRIANGAIKDLSGNNYAGFNNNTTWNFTAGDAVAPVLAAAPFSPADNATNVTVGTNLTVTFNENVQTGAGLIELFDASDNLVESFNVATSPLVTVNNAIVTINPTNNLSNNTSYYVHIANGAVRDLSGNNYAGFNDNTTWNFTVPDMLPPALIAAPFSPADNAISVPLNTNLTVTFNENIAVGAGLIELFDSTNTLIESFNVAASPLVSVTNATITINPTNNLGLNKSYNVHIANGAIKDLSGNNYAGFNDNTTWNFRSLAIDTIPPVLDTMPFSPADNSNDVPLNTNLTVNFNENVARGAGWIQLFNATTNELIELFNASSSPRITINGATVVIDPTNNLNNNVPYYVTISNGAIKDLLGNNYVGFNDNETWNFRAEGSTVGIDEPGLSKTQDYSWNGRALNILLSKTYKANLYDATGKLIMANLKKNTDCTSLPAGIYFVRLSSDNHSQTIRLYVP